MPEPTYAEIGADEKRRLHEAAGAEAKTPPGDVTLYRIRCACGWGGCWYAEVSNAERSIARHVELSR